MCVIIRLRHSVRYSISGLLVQVECHICSVCPSIYPLVSTVYFGKMEDVIEMLFGVVGQVGPRNNILDEGPDPLLEMAIFGRNLGGAM